MSLRWRIALALAAIAAATTISVGMASYRATSDAAARGGRQLARPRRGAKSTTNPDYRGNAELLNVYIVQIVVARRRPASLYRRRHRPARPGPAKAWQRSRAAVPRRRRRGGTDYRVVSGRRRLAARRRVAGRSLARRERQRPPRPQDADAAARGARDGGRRRARLADRPHGVGAARPPDACRDRRAAVRPPRRRRPGRRRRRGRPARRRVQRDAGRASPRLATTSDGSWRTPGTSCARR